MRQTVVYGRLTDFGKIVMERAVRRTEDNGLPARLVCELRRILSGAERTGVVFVLVFGHQRPENVSGLWVEAGSISGIPYRVFVHLFLTGVRHTGRMS